MALKNIYKDISSNIMAKDRLSIKQRSRHINTTALGNSIKLSFITSRVAISKSFVGSSKSKISAGLSINRAIKILPLFPLDKTLTGNWRQSG